MTVTTGKEHRFLGMDFDYSRPGVLRVTMIKYIEDILEDFPEFENATHREFVQG
jgi:hypothetical protein